MKAFLRLIIIAGTTFVILKASTFGWWFSDLPLTPGKDDRLIKDLKSHVYRLAQEIGDRSVYKYERLIEAEAYISEQFRLSGYNVELQSYTVLDKEVKNIIATKAGAKRPDEIIVVGAHYDSCFNPGADDNASACAALLELARSLSNQQTNRSIKFISFVNEEPPFFKTKNMGSRVYTKDAKAKKENIKAAIILEMVGYYSEKPFSQRYPPIYGLLYPNKGNFICVLSNTGSRWLAKKIISSFKQKTKFPIEGIVNFGFIPGADFSDHWSFWQEGYPAAMITDTAFYRNPHYHSSSDTYEKLNYESLAEVVQGLDAALLALAE